MRKFSVIVLLLALLPTGLFAQSSVGGGGTVTVNPAGLATSTKQSDGSQKTQVVDGAGNVIGATANALDVNIKSGSSSGLAATDYGTTGAPSAHILTVQGNAAGVAQPVSGTVTANAGTNLNTSTLALEAGGNLAAAATSLGTLDNTVSGNEIQADIVSSALPTGASTAAKQPALGTAGTASIDVITVQGIASMTPIKVDPGTADAADGAAPTNPPLPVTGRARATEVAAVDADDSLTVTESLIGGALVHVGALPQDRWQSSSAGTTIADTTAVAVIAHTDDYFSVVSNLLITNSDATVGTVVKILMGTGTVCGTGTAILFEGYAAALGGGFAIANPEGLFSTTAHSNDICIAAVTTSAEIQWSASGYKTKLDRVSN